MNIVDETTIIKIYNDGVDAVISLVKDLNNQISGLSEQVKILDNRIMELEARLNKNSSTSSKPLSIFNVRTPTGSRIDCEPESLLHLKRKIVIRCILSEF